MCMMCEDDGAYQAYMSYLDAMERKGTPVDPDKAMDALLDHLEAAQRPIADMTLSTHTPSIQTAGVAASFSSSAASSSARLSRSPFSCDPVDE